MKMLSGLLFTAALVAFASAASASDKVDVIVVTAKKPAATMLTDMTDEIFAETGDELRAAQPERPALAAPEIRIEIPSLAPAHG